MRPTLTGTGPLDDAPGVCPNPNPERYTPGPLLGSGGMGAVWRVWDAHLGRHVAMKVGGGETFTAEIALTARLVHPGIVAVYDGGVLPDGRAWYTMREYPEAGTLRDRTLEPARLVRILHQVAEAVSYAHAEGVVHRDLKPANILLGQFGEVLVADWGIAARIGSSPRAGGTAGYAAPEQLSGGDADPRTDVYALGVLLRGGPPELAPFVARCTGPVEERPRDASLVAEHLAAWIDGALRREEAAAQLQRTRARLSALEAARAVADRDTELARRAADTREARWAAEDRAEASVRAVDAAEAELEQGLRGTIELDPGLDEAHQLLAALYRDRAVRAERVGDTRAARWAAEAVAHHDRGALRDWVRGDGFLDLDVGPETVRLARFEERGRRLVAIPFREVQSPIRGLRLPAGSWIATVRGVGVPFVIERGACWEHVPPGARTAEPLALPGELGADDCFVAGGVTRLGGDPLAGDAAAATEAWIDPFVIRRFATTVAEYGAFLRDLVPAERDRYNPPADPTALTPGDHRLFDDEGRLSRVLRPGAPSSPRHAVAHLSPEAALAYTAWLATTTGQPWRLPTEWEREKAARGVDGRPLPWGSHFEPSWACLLGSRPGPPTPEPVDSHPTDASVYGVRGTCGHVRDVCENEWTRDVTLDGGRVCWTPGHTLFAARGGAWRAAPYFCRPAGRFAIAAGTWTGVVGVRPCRDV